MSMKEQEEMKECMWEEGMNERMLTVYNAHMIYILRYIFAIEYFTDSIKYYVICHVCIRNRLCPHYLYL